MNDISIILNVYKRPEYLERQIKSILNQSIKINPENIHIWYNKSDKAQYHPTDKKINTYICNYNTKFWGRFTIPLLCTTKYIAIFDDDILPQKDWLKNCVESMEKQEGIYGGSGVIVNKNGYYPNKKIGWNGLHSNKIERVDLVGHAWFFKQEWVKYLWMEKPYTWDNGEDIMFSYLIQKYVNINTYVPPHPDNNRIIWCTDYSYSAKVGNDENAFYLSNTNNHYNVRNNVVKFCINKGWNIINN